MNKNQYFERRPSFSFLGASPFGTDFIADKDAAVNSDSTDAGSVLSIIDLQPPKLWSKLTAHQVAPVSTYSTASSDPQIGPHPRSAYDLTFRGFG